MRSTTKKILIAGAVAAATAAQALLSGPGMELANGAWGY